MKVSMMKHSVVALAILGLMACGKDAQVAQAKTTPVVSADSSKSQGQQEVSQPQTAESNSNTPQGYELIKKIHADMNQDGLDDWLMVYERVNMPDEERLFQIQQTQSSGEVIVFENKGLAACKSCGGTRTDDPLVSVSSIQNGFVIVTEGGSREAWSRSVTFKYSRIDKSWQLVEVSEKSVDSQTGKQSKSVVLRPPKDFGKINFQDEDFDLMSLFK